MRLRSFLLPPPPSSSRLLARLIQLLCVWQFLDISLRSVRGLLFDWGLSTPVSHSLVKRSCKDSVSLLKHFLIHGSFLTKIEKVKRALSTLLTICLFIYKFCNSFIVSMTVQERVGDLCDAKKDNAGREDERT